MSYEIENVSAWRKDFPGENSWMITFTSLPLSPVVGLEEEKEFGYISIYSHTDGYHWLNFFLSQKTDAEKMVDHEPIEQSRLAALVFKDIGNYRDDDKESGYLHTERVLDKNLVREIADLIEPRFANRQRFF